MHAAIAMSPPSPEEGGKVQPVDDLFSCFLFLYGISLPGMMGPIESNLITHSFYSFPFARTHRYLDDIHSNDRSKVAQAERQAVNSVIQGSAADLMKLAMIKMSARIMDWKKEGATGDGTDVAPKILVQIHDELLFEVVANKSDINRLRDAVMRCCAEECVREFRMSVPLKLKCSYGASWGSMAEM